MVLVLGNHADVLRGEMAGGSTKKRKVDDGWMDG